MKKLLFKIIGAGLNLLYFFRPKTAIQIAIDLFATPRRSAIRQKELDFLQTARQVRAEIGDKFPIVEYHWGESDAPLVLLSYGWEYNAGRWRHFVPALVEAGFQVLAYDPPGHGLAPNGQMHAPRNAFIVKSLIEKYGRPEVIVGHSFGGSSAVLALHDLPEFLHPKRLVVMASFSYAPAIFRDYARQLGLCKALYYSIVRKFEQEANRPLDYFDFARMTADFSHISGLLVHSPSDDVSPHGEARRYFNFWDGAALFSPPSGGHHLGTAEITAAVLDFSIAGNLPQGVEIQEFPLAGRHDLVRHFSGL